MFKINLSIDDDYHSQVNNKWIPLEACNSTAAIMWLKAGRVDFWHPKMMQPEDYLTAILNGKDAWRLFREQHLDMYELGFRPQNVSRMLAWGIDIMLGREIDHYITTGSLALLVWELLSKRPVIMSGQFTSSGHFVTVVGCVSSQNKSDIEFLEDVEESDIEEIIVDDPYGNYHSGYKNQQGNNVSFKRDKFDTLTNLPKGAKWMHMMNPLMIEG
jgi:hypothetical protein